MMCLIINLSNSCILGNNKKLQQVELKCIIDFKFKYITSYNQKKIVETQSSTIFDDSIQKQ
jgi:hypothetical protein